MKNVQTREMKRAQKEEEKADLDNKLLTSPVS